MGRVPFHKTAKANIQLLQQMKDNNLQIESDSEALFFLHRVNYFRLSGYSHHFQDKERNNRFLDGTTFTDITNLYIFDQKLRLLLFEAIERVETFFLTILNNTMSLEKRDQSMVQGHEWYMNTAFFKEDSRNYIFFIKKICKKIEKIKNKRKETQYSFIKDFYEKYENEILPSWMMIQLLDFGEIQTLFTSLSSPYQKKICQTIGIPQGEITNILSIIRYLRNICAHHERIWNKKMFYPVGKGNKELKKYIPDAQHAYYQSGIIVVAYFLSKSEFNTTWFQRIHDLFIQYDIPEVENVVTYLQKLICEQNA